MAAIQICDLCWLAGPEWTMSNQDRSWDICTDCKDRLEFDSSLGILTDDLSPGDWSDRELWLEQLEALVTSMYLWRVEDEDEDEDDCDCEGECDCEEEE